MKNKNTDTSSQFINWLSWLFGIGLTCLIIAYLINFEIVNFTHFFSLNIVIPWFVSTFFARLLLAEVFVRPIHALGFPISRRAAFWLGWLRTFFNQVIPLSGITLISVYCKKKCGLAWGEIASLSSPLYLVSIVVTSIFAMGAIFLNTGSLERLFVLLAVVLFFISATCTIIILRGSIGIALMPSCVRHHFYHMEQSLRLFEKNLKLLICLSLCYGGIILLRCFRLSILFILGTNLHLSIQEIIILASISEFGFLLPLIPGGIGIREGTMVSVGWLLGLNIEIVAVIALIDRLLSIFLVAVMAIPAYFVLRKEIL